MSLQPGTYVAVEGAIGSGKTSLAKILAGEFQSRLVLEEAEPNPFLKDFYRDPRRYALQTQLAFLLSRHRQLCETRQTDIFNTSVISDYVFEKDRIFAALNLDEREFRLYSRVSALLEGELPTPDLVVYMQSSPERLLTNIRIRDFEYERSITIEYLRELCEAYHQFFFNWDRSPLLILNTTRIDFVNNPDHRSALVKIIERLPQGTTYFNPEA